MSRTTQSLLRRIKLKNRSLSQALIATTVLAGISTLAFTAWQSGYPQWAFALVFLAVWLVISVSWANVRFNKESGLMLAGIVVLYPKQRLRWRPKAWLG